MLSTAMMSSSCERVRVSFTEVPGRQSYLFHLIADVPQIAAVAKDANRLAFLGPFEIC